MSDLDKIAHLLSSDAVDKRIAAAIVLGELRARGPQVVDALAATLDSGIALLQSRALEALARAGAKRALPKILPLLGEREEEVRTAAVAAVVSVGDDALPLVKARLAEATGEERRSLDRVLAALGGKDAFHALLEGLSANSAEAAKAAAIAVRQRVKEADARQRRAYLSETERFLQKAQKGGTGKDAAAGAIAAGVKILGYLEDDKAIPTLLAFARAGNAPAVRQEALIALRFLVQGDAGGRRAGLASVVTALVDAALDEDRALAQTALHTLAGIDLPEESMKRLQKLLTHPDLDRARFAMEMLGRQDGAAPARLLVDVLASTRDKRRAELAASCLLQREDGQAGGAPGTLPVRDDAVPPLARALLETEDADRAWMLRSVLRPSAKKVASALSTQMLATATKRLAGGDRNWEPLLAVVRDADPTRAAAALRELATRLRKSNPEKALTVLRVLCRGEGSTDEDRYALAAAELGAGRHDTHPAARAGDESLRLFGALLARGVDVGARLRKDRSLELEHLYYVGFHFAEQAHPLGEELLRAVVERGGRAKIAKMARSKLALAEQA
jgi:HEAT repeat protein